MGEIVSITRVSSPVRSSVRRSSMSMRMRGLPSSRDQLRSIPHCLMLVSTEAKISGSGSKHRQLHEAKAPANRLRSESACHHLLDYRVTHGRLGLDPLEIAHSTSWTGRKAGLLITIAVSWQCPGSVLSSRVWSARPRAVLLALGKPSRHRTPAADGQLAPVFAVERCSARRGLPIRYRVCRLGSAGRAVLRAVQVWNTDAPARAGNPWTCLLYTSP